MTNIQDQLAKVEEENFALQVENTALKAEILALKLKFGELEPKKPDFVLPTMAALDNPPRED